MWLQGADPAAAHASKEALRKEQARHVDVVAGGFGRTPECPVVRGRRPRRKARQTL